jgi:hypothetical protein
MRGAAKSFLPLPPISVSDSPMEKLQLIEQVQGECEWLINIEADSPQQMQALQELAESLDASRYSTFMDKDITGKDVLRVHHIGRNTSVAQGFESLGIIGGMRHLVDKAAHPVCELGKGAAHFAKYTADDPARLLAGLWLMGDIFYSQAGSSKDGELTLDGKLMNFSGYMAILQSALYIGLARDSNECMVEDVGNKIQDAIHQGVNPFNHALWDISPEKKNESAIDKVVDFIKKNPIEVGAWIQMTGQVGLAASGLVNVSKGNTEGWWDVSRAATSITAWGVLQMDEQHTEHKTAWSDNPVKRIMQEVRESPHKFASPINMLASSLGIYSSHKKQLANERDIAQIETAIHSVEHTSIPYQTDASLLQGLKLEREELIKERPNPMQFAAETTYLLGDATMFFARKANYGGGGSEDTVHAAKAAAHFIANSEMVMTDSRLKEFVSNLSHYMAERTVIQQREEGSVPDAELENAHIERLAHSLNRDIFAQIAGQSQRADQVANVIARISDTFPKAQQPALQEALIDSISGIVGVNIDREEMMQSVKNHYALFTEMHVTEQPHQSPSMAQVAPLLAELTFLLPSVNAALNASTLYDTVLDFTKPSPARAQFFDAALMQQAAEDVGVSPAVIQQHQRASQRMMQPELAAAR